MGADYTGSPPVGALTTYGELAADNRITGGARDVYASARRPATRPVR